MNTYATVNKMRDLAIKAMKDCSPAAIRHNLAIESIVGFWWIMFVKVINMKDNLTGHLPALSNFRYGHYSM